MKIQNPSPKKKIIVTSLIVLLLAGVGAVGYFNSPLYVPQNNPDNTQTKDDDDTNSTDSGTTPSTPVDDGETPADNMPDQDQADQLSAQIHVPNYQAADGTITVNISINEVWSDGQCVVRVEGPKNDTASMDVFPAAQNSGCGPRVSGLPAGTYTVTAWAERNNARTNTVTLNVTLD